MQRLSAIVNLIRASLVLALVCLLAFGSLATHAAAGQDAHHTAVALDEREAGHAHTGAACSKDHAEGSHEADGAACCVGTCSIVIDMAALAVTPTMIVRSHATVFQPMAARPSPVDFYRPPSLKS
jgi:hypothetical protein